MIHQEEGATSDLVLIAVPRGKEKHYVGKEAMDGGGALRFICPVEAVTKRGGRCPSSTEEQDGEESMPRTFLCLNQTHDPPSPLP